MPPGKSCGLFWDTESKWQLDFTRGDGLGILVVQVFFAANTPGSPHQGVGWKREATTQRGGYRQESSKLQAEVKVVIKAKVFYPKADLHPFKSQQLQIV